MNEWHIQSRSHTCQISGKHFADKEAYYTLLLEERSELKRIDVCEAVWRERYHDAKATDAGGYVSHWKGVYEAPPAAPPEPIQKDTAESLLRKLIERNSPDFGAACYILAVMLERKRLLRVKEQLRRDGHRVFIYEQPRTGDIFTITDPDLRMDQLDAVQHQVADLLEHGLPSEEAVQPREDPFEPPVDAAAEAALLPASVEPVAA
jgi:hypothetical protein